MGYPSPPGDGFDELATTLRELAARIAELERPTGTQTAQALAQLQALVAGLVSATNISVSGNISAGGSVTGGTGVFNGGLTSTDVYSRLLTYGGLYRATWCHVDGTVGYVPSSARFKTQIADAPSDVDAVLSLRPRTFRYIAAVEALGDEAVLEHGLIAEEVESTGLTQLVDYDEDGQPFGVRYERLAVELLAVVKSQEARIVALEEQIATA